MAQSDHKTAESSESSEERGMLFVASQESAVITEPGNGALDDPSAAIAAQRPAILSQVLGPTVGKSAEERSFRCPVLRGFDPGRRYHNPCLR